jgi:three-Cys-motif partner protein
MDTKGIIQEHSKIKLDLYRLYLERYLAVLLVAPYFASIWIHDVFAGSGISKNNEKGSPIIAAEVIKSISTTQNPKNKSLRLSLNDSDNDNFLLLQENIRPYQFATVKNIAAEQYVQSWSPQNNSHNLFFFDPHGYTQISIRNLEKLFATANCDFLIFVPIYHIYRFLRKDNLEELKPLEDQLKPIASFLADLNIQASSAVGSLEDFSNLIVEALRRISKTSYVYKQIIDNKMLNSRYGLFFITHNILGADKFLEAQDKLKKAIEEKRDQMAFSFIEDGPSIFEDMEKGKKYDNVELYKLGILIGILPPEVNIQLKQLETEGKIKVEVLPGKKRVRGSFYINYSYYKDQKKMIVVYRS